MNNSNDEFLHVIYDYTSKGDDELTLKRGSVLEVLSKDERISGSEGWWTGRLLNSESVGVFPANFVANAEPNLRIIDYKDLQIGELIGIGGFGHVHYGKFGDVHVAIKTAKSLTSYNIFSTSTSQKTSMDDQSDAVHKNLIDGLLREARLFSNLNHPNIIQLFGVSPCLATKNLYLVMEYAHGGALSELLYRRKSGLFPNVFIEYAKQIADGMRYLHGEAPGLVIHRDLKCSNILILESIENVHDDYELLQKTLKITDFGLAKKQLQSSSMTTAGTYPWMSPECIRNNEFSTKSDVWSYGVLLWECLTGEIPYKGFDQMQVAFGIATNKYSLPIPSTCPEEFSQLMKECWHVLPQNRLSFNELHDRIVKIIETNYSNAELNNIETNEGSYSSLQQDWRKEIQTIFDELKTKEQQIRDREQAMLQKTLEQNDQRLQLEQWEHELHEREMHVIERELSLLMLTNQQERLQHQTPKAQKRSGRFMRSLLHAALNGNASLSSATATSLISSPTNFRHLISVCRDPGMNRHHPASDQNLLSPVSDPSSPIGSSAKSTPTTPNLSRLRTLTLSEDLTLNKLDDGEFLINNDVHQPLQLNGVNSPEKPTRCSSGTLPRSRWHNPKSWSSSAGVKRKHGKTKVRPGEAKWYLDSESSISKANDDETKSATPIVESNSKQENSDEIISIGLGRRLPTHLPSSTSTLKSPPSEIKSKQQNPSSSSANTTPSPLTKKQHKRACSSPTTNGLVNIGYCTRPAFSSTRPNSLVLSSTSSSSLGLIPNISQSDSQLDETYFHATKQEDRQSSIDGAASDNFYSVKSSKMSTSMTTSNSQPLLNCPYLIDIDTEEQLSHKYFPR
ncbi:unnamed protein product [Adineta ricciae]|uniref:mitogen-activated protein kinase kinase kinase n=1 Tax=Adineta ricciae TaxID=249248 RepID=A0A813VQP6_ADIRI|nr:unnamed protein product [Adineta ricciae]